MYHHHLEPHIVLSNSQKGTGTTYRFDVVACCFGLRPRLNGNIFCIVCELVLLPATAPRSYFERKSRTMGRGVLTSPLSFLKNIVLPSDVAIPAASWPRCCRIVRPSYSSGDTCASRSASRMPITPHIIGPAGLVRWCVSCCLVRQCPLLPSNRRVQQ